jgi:ribosomal protein L11 methyltransferase
LFRKKQEKGALLPRRVLDIGTGSGVLLICAGRLGAETGIGIDTDPCARVEAGANLRLNKLQGSFRINGHSLDSIQGFFDLITANLRTPSLLELSGRIADLSAIGGALVVSGMRPDEADRVRDEYGIQGFRCNWKQQEKNWAGMILERACS